MKKTLGKIIIGISSFLLLIFAFSFPEIYSAGQTSKEKAFLIGFFILVIGLIVLALLKGIKMTKNIKLITVIPFNNTLDIKLSGKVNYKDYRNLILALSFRKPLYIFFLVIFMGNILNTLSNKNISITKFQPENYMAFIFLSVFILMPFFTITQIKKMYASNKILNEHITYSLSNDTINIKGETFDSTIQWNHFIKIKETKKFFMLYQGKTMATLLDKQMFSNDDEEVFKQFINSLNIEKA